MILMNCGGQDTVWNSCGYAQAVMDELAHSKFPHHLQRCAGCDHLVGRGIPDEPYADSEGAPNPADIHTYTGFFAATIALLNA